MLVSMTKFNKTEKEAYLQIHLETNSYILYFITSYSLIDTQLILS